MEDQFPQQLGGSTTRSATALMYFHHHSPSPNPSTSLQPKPETRPGSTRNPYGRNSHDEDDVIKAKIVSHPHYSALLRAYLNCQSVGAPAEVGERLSVIAREIEARQRASLHCVDAATSDPELDQFMEAYCNMLVKYREELTRPLQEAMVFLRSVESQLNALTNGAAGSVFSAALSRGYCCYLEYYGGQDKERKAQETQHMINNTKIYVARHSAYVHGRN